MSRKRTSPRRPLPRSEANTFINCPFDSSYKPIFDSIVFAVHDCGFRARCALEIEDSSQVRIDKVFEIIEGCPLGIHDLSRTELDERNGLPRFNMPLELGIFLGAKRFGSPRQRGKRCLVLDRESYRYQIFCSDIAGQDIRSHGGSPEEAIKVIRNWLQTILRGRGISIPIGSAIATRYNEFQDALPLLCRETKKVEDELIYEDRVALIVEWLRMNPW